tara:strand:- start:2173 stop:2877 length:705 start_codon:yes stop_codon:yes gene_type:complete
MKSICICCRGNSLKYIKNVPKVDSYLLVNDFSGEIEISDVKETLTGSNIYHLFNNWNYMYDIPRMVNKNFYTEFNVKKIVSAYLKDTSSNSKYSIVGRDGEIPFEWYPEELKEYMWTQDKNKFANLKANAKYKWDFPSCGNGAALYGAYHATDEIHIIGMDFYTDLDNCYASGEVMRDLGHGSNEMKDFLIEQTFLKFPNKKFYMYVTSDFDYNLDNVSVIRVGKEDLQWWENK